jgi:sulfoxide reductase heme-binding subunit YedZ
MTKLSKSIKDASMIINPSSCRGELGIWFLLLGTGHFILLLTQRSIFSFINIGGGGYALANLLGLIGLFLALLLAATSFRKVISYIGGDLWRWLHSLTHAIFYLIAGHYLYFQFFSASRENGADWFGYLAVVMILIVVVLQLVTFFVELKRRRAKINEVMVSIQPEKMLDI